MTTFLVGVLCGALAAALLAWLDDGIRREMRRRRQLRTLRAAAPLHWDR